MQILRYLLLYIYLVCLALFSEQTLPVDCRGALINYIISISYAQSQNLTSCTLYVCSLIL